MASVFKTPTRLNHAVSLEDHRIAAAGSMKGTSRTLHLVVLLAMSLVLSEKSNWK